MKFALTLLLCVVISANCQRFGDRISPIGRRVKCYKFIGSGTTLPPVRVNCAEVNRNQGVVIEKDSHRLPSPISQVIYPTQTSGVKFNFGCQHKISKIEKEFDETLRGVCPQNFICVNWQLCKNGAIIVDGSGSVDSRRSGIPSQIKQNHQQCGKESICCNACNLDSSCRRNVNGIQQEIFNQNIDTSFQFPSVDFDGHAIDNPPGYNLASPVQESPVYVDIRPGQLTSYNLPTLDFQESKIHTTTSTTKKPIGPLDSYNLPDVDFEGSAISIDQKPLEPVEEEPSTIKSEIKNEPTKRAPFTLPPPIKKTPPKKEVIVPRPNTFPPIVVYSESTPAAKIPITQRPSTLRPIISSQSTPRMNGSMPMMPMMPMPMIDRQNNLVMGSMVMTTLLGTPLIGGVCSAGTFCVTTDDCNLQTGFIVMYEDQKVPPIPFLPTVPLLKCSLTLENKQAEGICCQVPYPLRGPNGQLID